MPELPEVEAITATVKKHAVGRTMVNIEVLRGKYLGGPGCYSPYREIRSVHRVGKQICFDLGSDVMYVHNAMSGFFDWEHEPWTFDYVEGKRSASASDVRVRIHMDDGSVLRFHDTRLFGRMSISPMREPGNVGPELLRTEHGRSGPVIYDDLFHSKLQAKPLRPIKDAIMDQSLVAGVGNIYASEGLHEARIRPDRASGSLSKEESSVLLESLRCAVLRCIPQVRYDWLKVYRRTSCGTCENQVTRTIIKGRSTFHCERCQ